MSSRERSAVLLAVCSLLACAPTDPGESARGGIGPGGLLLDRMGRPEIANFVLRDSEAKDRYNREDAFAVSASNLPGYATLMRTGLVGLDRLDGQLDWTHYLPSTDPTADPVVQLLLGDFLLVDPRRPCTVDSDSYLAVERNLLEGRPYASCGGRTPNGDAIDALLTYFVAHDRERIRDGVDAPAIRASDEFPYLASPHAAPAGKFP